MLVIVKCYGCDTRFRIDDSKVPPKGFRTTCSVCGAVIAVEPLTKDATATSPSGDRPPAPEPRPQPTGEGASPSPGPQPADPPPQATTPPDEPPEVPDQIVHHGSREELQEEPLPQDATATSPSGDRPPAPEPRPQPTDAGASASPGPQPADPPPQATTPPDEPPEFQDQIVHHGSREELIKMVLDAEGERREMASKMTRELFRLRQVVEREQMVVSRLVDAVSNLANGDPSPTAPTQQAEGNEKLLARQEQLIRKLLDAERERRQMASKMTSELFRLREVVERQQMVASRLVDAVSNLANGDPSPTAPTEQAERNEKLLARQEELLEKMLDAERERSQMASKMTSELFQLREVVEQQQMVASRLVDAVSKQITAPLDAPTEQAEGNEKLLARQEELIKKLLNAERERREMASKMTSELFRLREVVEQQQMVVSGLGDAVSNLANGDPSPTAPTEQVERNEKLLARQEELLEKMLDAERERRETAAEMTKKLFGFREVVQQQQMVVSRLVDAVSTEIPAPLDTDLANGDPSPTAPTEQAEGDEELLARQEELEEELQRLRTLLDREPVGDEELLARQEELEEELQRLKTALDREKEVVERLRHGKLDLERRATKAEATIEASDKPGFLRRLLNRGGD